MLFLALTLVFSTATLTAMAKKASAETSVSTASEDKAPDPVFMSDYWALGSSSRVYYTDSRKIEQLTVSLKKKCGSIHFGHPIFGVAGFRGRKEF